MGKFNYDEMSVSTFYELHQLQKFVNIDISDEKINPQKQEKILQNILNNLPMGTIVFSQKREEKSGKTMFHVLKGTDKVASVIHFLNKELETKTSTNDPIFNDKKKAEQFWSYHFPVIHYYGIHEDYEKIHEILSAMEV